MRLFRAAREAGYDGVQAKPSQYDFCEFDAARFRNHYGDLTAMVSPGLVVRLGANVGSWAKTLAPIVEFAAGIGAAELCLTAGVREATSGASAVAEIARVVNEIGRRTRERSVRLSLHNLAGTVLDSVEDFERLYQTADPDLCGLTFDTGHGLRGAMTDVTASLERLMGFVSCVHLKDADAEGRFCSLGTGGVPLAEVLEIVSRHGYRGWIVVDESAAEEDIGRSLSAAAELVRERARHGA